MGGCFFYAPTTSDKGLDYISIEIADHIALVNTPVAWVELLLHKHEINKETA